MMRLPNSNKQRRVYWTIQTLLIGPIILLWSGVAYWFGFASEVLLRIVMPDLLAPLFLTGLLVAAFVWTMLHRCRIPRCESEARRTDTAICVFIAFSMLLVVGQLMAM